MTVVQVPIPASAITNLFTSAFEGASPWVERVELDYAENPPAPTLVFWGTDAVFEGRFRMRVTCDCPEGGSATYVVDNQRLRRGLQQMATRTPRHFADILRQDADDTTADVFLQMVLFGEVMFD